MLDTPSYVAQAGHRFSPDQRAEVHARAQPGLTAPFVSAAFPYAIYLWAPGAVWARAVAVAGLAVAAGYAYGRRAAIRA